MNSVSTVSTIVATSVLLAFSGISRSEETKRFDRPQAETVRASDLNLASHADVEILYRRIQSAAISACRADAALWDVKRVLHQKKCVESAVEVAVTSPDVPLLTAIHGTQRQPVAGL